MRHFKTLQVTVSEGPIKIGQIPASPIQTKVLIFRSSAMAYKNRRNVPPSGGTFLCAHKILVQAYEIWSDIHGRPYYTYPRVYYQSIDFLLITWARSHQN